MNRFLLVIFCLAFSLNPLQANGTSFTDTSHTRLNLSYNFGKFIAIENSYAEADLFVPFYGNSCWQAFVDASIYRFNNNNKLNDKWAGSGGIGVRSQVCKSNVIGINAFYDFREGRCRHNFKQIGLGLEWLNNCWDIRVNGYLPISKKSFINRTCFFNLGDGLRSKKRNLEWAYTGYDAEIGIPFFRTCEFNMYGAAGPYYYTRDHREHFCGGFARVELDWRSIVNLEARYSYDRIHHSCFQGIVELSIPFDCCSVVDICQNLLFRPIRRNGIIQTDHCCDWRWNW